MSFQDDAGDIQGIREDSPLPRKRGRPRKDYKGVGRPPIVRTASAPIVDGLLPVISRTAWDRIREQTVDELDFDTIKDAMFEIADMVGYDMPGARTIPRAALRMAILKTLLGLKNAKGKDHSLAEGYTLSEIIREAAKQVVDPS